MGSKQPPAVSGLYTRGELELALGRLVLSLDRLETTRVRHLARKQPQPLEPINAFLDGAAAIYSRARPEHREALLQRLSSLAQATDLGLVGLEEWLEGTVSPHSTSDQHIAVQVAWEGEGTSVSSNGRL